MSIENRVIIITADAFGVEPETLHPTHALDDFQDPDGLYLDSLDRLELIMALEVAFDIEIPDEHIDRIEATPRGIADYIQSRLGNEH